MSTITNEVKEIDASINFCCWLASCPIVHFGFCPYKTTLLLEKEEVLKTDVNLFGKNISRRPYGELGAVDKTTVCCFVNPSSSFGDMCIGCGCETEKVEEIVMELKRRMKERGDTAMIQKSEEQLERIAMVEKKLDLIMEHLNIPQPEKMERDE